MSTEAPAIQMVTLTIDDREVSVPKGTLLIEAARGMGIDIPYLCYHHKLTPFGGCRLCLVEVEKARTPLVAACNTLVADGMVVRTATDKVKSQRAGALEFVLLNHPLDCPVCDKGGECELQDRVFECGTAESRMTEPKVHLEDYDLGPLIVRNQDRCIICRRCIKVMEEIVGDPVIEFGQRGVTTEVYTFEHSAFRPGFSGNTIPVCPVGALMSKPFRFKARPWELIKTPSICTLCSMGCNIRADVRENRLLRVVGLENPRVNDGWLCDRGQFGYDYTNSPERLRAPLLRKNGQLEQVSWEEALAFTAGRLSEVKRMYGGKALGFLGSERASNEDNFVFQQFARETLECPNLDHRMGRGRGNYAQFRPTPGAIEALPGSDVALLFASDLTAEVPVLDLVLKRGLLKGRMKLIIAHPRRIELNRFASQWLRYAPGAEVAAANALVLALFEEGLADPEVTGEQVAAVDAVRRGLDADSLAALAEKAGLEAEAVRQVARAFAGAGCASIVFGSRAADTEEALVSALRNLAVLSGQSKRAGHVFMEAVEGCNTWGARDMGVLPDSGPAYGKAAPGLGTPAMVRALAGGQLRAVYVMGSNPVVDYPDAGLVQRALDSAELLVVQDIFLTETAELADVVLPTVTAAEEGSTLTNVEGRVQRTVRALDPIGAARPDWEILTDLATRMDASLGYSGPQSVERQIRSVLTAGVAGAASRPDLAQADTPAGADAPDDASLRLFIGTTMFNRDAVQRHSTVLPDLAGEPWVEVHPETAAATGLADGEKVEVRSSFGEPLILLLRVSDATPPRAAFIPGGFNDAPVNRLLNDTGEAVWVSIGRIAARRGATA